ncbi:hypothetical protein RclHR1_06580012 [Rhizophagus clarus]|uniref:Uncharacterized protein n=1 Tax=Rhizophagus clarus TaxID=94130 RepID=A0A2Z6S992_9GLOM|nr:hypothetical protein RclHR1_06580012 [Rhizophagus clarus]
MLKDKFWTPLLLTFFNKHHFYPERLVSKVQNTKGLELHFEADHCPELYFEVDQFNPELFKSKLWYFKGPEFRGGSRQTSISKVWKSFIGRLLSERSGLSYFEGPEEADHSILKVQNSKQTEDGPHLTADQVSS